MGWLDKPLNDSNLFSRANQIKFPLSSICLAVCKASESSVCLLVTILALIEFYYKFRHYTNTY